MSVQALHKALDSLREIEISVTGRKTGRTITLPVWFVKQGKTLLLLPVRGSQSNWYRNVKHTPKIDVTGGDTKVRLTAHPTDDEATVNAVVEQFRAKYGARDVERYYPNQSVCVELTLP